MRNTAIFLAGIMVTSAVFAQIGGPMSEERYRMKYGRYSPAKEARGAMRADVSTEGAPACCRRIHASPAAADPFWQEVRFAAKYGRILPQAEARQRTAEAELATHIKKCVEIGQCERMRGASVTAAAVTSGLTDTELRFRAKYGRSAPSEAGRAAANAKRLAAFAFSSGCEHECCKHGA